MRPSPHEFRCERHKRISLVGTAGVGKTRLAGLLRRHHWFHYSADYRIGTRYLDEPILDEVKRQAMRVPFLRALLRSDSIYIASNVTEENVTPVTSFIGRPGDPERGGISLPEFRRRQALYRDGLERAMRDVPDFIRKARDVYGYAHFVNDTAGSLCELESPEVIELLARHTLILYIRPSDGEESRLLASVEAELRPLCYREEFLDEQLAAYRRRRGLEYVAQIDPGDFYHEVLPRLHAARARRYEEIAARHGYIVMTGEIAAVRDEASFLELVERAIERNE